MTNNIIVSVDGISYDGFKEVYIRRSLDTVSGFFRLIVNSHDVSKFPLKMGQTCEIFIDNNQVINGFIEKIDVIYGAYQGSQDHNLIIEGRDKTSDLVDSTLDGEFTYNGSTSLVTIISDVISKIGISGVNVINNVPDLESYNDDYIVSSSVGDNAFEFLERYARLREVLLTSDGQGNILITRAADGNPTSSLINTKELGNVGNIISARMVYDNTKRYSKYTAFSQAQISSLNYFASNTNDLTDISGQSIDEGIRGSRLYNFINENNATREECEKRAKWERNSRISPSKVYVPTVFGFRDGDSNTLWSPNKIVRVQDEFANMSSDLLLNVVEFSQGLTAGSKTTLTLIDKDSYSTKIAISRSEEQSRLEGRDFGVEYFTQTGG